MGGLLGKPLPRRARQEVSVILRGNAMAGYKQVFPTPSAVCVCGGDFRIRDLPPSLSYLAVISNLSLKRISPPLQAFSSLCLPHSIQSSSLYFPLPSAPLPKGDHHTEVLSLESMVGSSKVSGTEEWLFEPRTLSDTEQEPHVFAECLILEE